MAERASMAMPTLVKKQHAKSLIWLNFGLKATKDGALMSKINLFVGPVAETFSQKAAIQPTSSTCSSKRLNTVAILS